LFINCADSLFGPITTIRSDGYVVKVIPWTAFTLSADDWRRVADARDILAVSFKMSLPSHCHGSHFDGRIQIESNNVSHPIPKLRSGRLSPSLKIFKRDGRRSAMGFPASSASQSIGLPFKMASTSSRSTITGLMRNPLIF
jgi:hypothetical protein